MANLYLIKQLAEKQGIPITELAEKVGVSEQQIHLMVRKNSTKIETLEKIAKVLGVSTSYFFDDEPPKTETFISTGKHGIQAKYIGSIDNRDMTEVDKKVEVEEVEEEFILPSNCPDETKYAVEKLKLRIQLLEQLVAEKERFINHLLTDK